MKVRVEIPASVVRAAYDQTVYVNQYDTIGSYIGANNVLKSFIPIWIESPEKRKAIDEDLKKLTKAQLLDWIKDQHSYNRYEMEVIE